MLKKILAITILNISLSANCFAQSGEWKTIQAEYNDLPYPNVNTIKVDKIGIIWVGTANGIGKYNGNDWEQFRLDNSGLPDSNVNVIEVDHNNGVWIGTYSGGLAYYNKNEWTVIDTSNSILRGNNIIDIVEANDSLIWILVAYPMKGDYDYSALYSFDGHTLIEINLDSLNILYREVSALATDNNGNLLIGRSKGISKYDGKQWIRYDFPDNFDDRLSVVDFKVDESGDIWLGTDFGFYKFYVYKNNEYQVIQDYKFADVRHIEIDTEGNKWIGSAQGVFKYNNDSSYEIYDRINSPLLNQAITGMAIDSSKNMWFGCFLGLTKYDGENWEYFSASSEFPGNLITTIVIDSNNTAWIGTETFGLVRIVNGEIAVFNKANSDITSNNIQSIVFDQNDNLWIGTGDKGISKYNNGIWINYTTENSELPDNTIRDICFDKDNNLWATSGSYIVMFNGTGWIIFDDKNSALSQYGYNSITADTNNIIWAGSFYDGLYKYDGIKWENFNIENSPLPSQNIRTLKLDADNNLWIGTTYGIVKYDGEEWTTFNSTNSELDGNDIWSIEFDKEGNVWVGKYWNYGISKYDGNRWTNYNYDIVHPTFDGISGVTISIDKNNNLWVGDWILGVFIFNEEGVVSIKQKVAKELPEEYKLYQNYPNPFNPATTISFSLASDAEIILKIFDITGSEIKTLLKKFVLKGRYEYSFNASGLPSGVYIYSLEIFPTNKGTAKTISKKMLLLK